MEDDAKGCEGGQPGRESIGRNHPASARPLAEWVAKNMVRTWTDQVAARFQQQISASIRDSMPESRFQYLPELGAARLLSSTLGRQQSELADVISRARRDSIPSYPEGLPASSFNSGGLNASTVDVLLARAEVIDTVPKFIRKISEIEQRHFRHDLVWRGQRDASWAIRSTLSRTAIEESGNYSEDSFVELERWIFEQSLAWDVPGVDAMDTLANLQHYGVPTRLLDVTRDPKVAAWFATLGESDSEANSGLVVAWGRRPKSSPRKYHDAGTTAGLHGTRDPVWWNWDHEERVKHEWGSGTRIRTWIPRHLNERMRAQRAAFVIDAAPLINDEVVDVIRGEEGWGATEITQAMSVLAVPSEIGKATRVSSPALSPMFVLELPDSVKPDIANYLDSIGINHSSMFPDLAGFVNYIGSKVR